MSNKTSEDIKNWVNADKSWSLPDADLCAWARERINTAVSLHRTQLVLYLESVDRLDGIMKSPLASARKLQRMLALPEFVTFDVGSPFWGDLMAALEADLLLSADNVTAIAAMGAPVLTPRWQTTLKTLPYVADFQKARELNAKS